MTDAVEHSGALLQSAFDALLHFDEGITRLPHLPRAVRPEVEVAALAEILRGVGQAQDRANLIAQKKDRHRQKYDRGAEHPQNKNMDVRLVSKVAMGHHRENPIAQINADLDQP